jgi:hypothetical protein
MESQGSPGASLSVCNSTKAPRTCTTKRSIVIWDRCSMRNN